MKYKSLAALLIYIASASVLFAQESSVFQDKLLSSVLEEERRFQVRLPENYKEGSDDKYTVLYYLDGKGNDKLITACHQFLVAEGYMPNVILVAVYNRDRNRDFLPTNNEYFPTSGGADNFLKFFRDELIPHIDANYPCNGENMIYGHSFGGVFAMHALLNEPQLFSTYIAVDPSFWWDNGFQSKDASEKLSNLDGMTKVLYISGREGQAYSGMGLDKMDSVLKAKAPETLDWQSVAYADESHGSVRYKTIYDGLRFAYEGYRSQIQFHPQAGIMLSDQPIDILIMTENPNVRFTTDGSEPTRKSAKVEQTISMPAPGQLRVKSFSKRGSSSNELTGDFKSGRPLKAGKLPRKFEQGGLNYMYYEGSWDSLPDFTSMKPISDGITSKEFTLKSLSKEMNFGCVFEGAIEIKEEGYYIFGLDSDDGSRFYINETLILDNDGLHATGNVKSYILPLEVGFYPIKLEYFQKEGGAEVSLVYLRPGNWQPQPFPIDQQYYRK